MNCDELSLVPMLEKQQCYTVYQIVVYCGIVALVFILMLALLLKVYKQKRRMQTIIKHNLAVPDMPDKEQGKKFSEAEVERSLTDVSIERSLTDVSIERSLTDVSISQGFAERDDQGYCSFRDKKRLTLIKAASPLS